MKKKLVQYIGIACVWLLFAPTILQSLHRIVHHSHTTACCADICMKLDEVSGDFQYTSQAPEDTCMFCEFEFRVFQSQSASCMLGIAFHEFAIIIGYETKPYLQDFYSHAASRAPPYVSII